MGRIGCLAIVSFGFAVSGIAAAQESAHFCGHKTAHPIDLAFAAAMQRSGGVTVDMRDAQGEAYQAWDRELNRLYAELMQRLEPEGRKSLRAAQRAWLAYDKAQGDWDWSSAMHGEEGTSAPLNVAAGGLTRRRARVCELESDLGFIRYKSPD